MSMIYYDLYYDGYMIFGCCFLYFFVVQSNFYKNLFFYFVLNILNFWLQFVNDFQNFFDNTVYFLQSEEKSQFCFDWLIGMVKRFVYLGCYDNEEVIVGFEVVGFLGDCIVYYCCSSYLVYFVSFWFVERFQ